MIDCGGDVLLKIVMNVLNVDVGKKIVVVCVGVMLCDGMCVMV